MSKYVENNLVPGESIVFETKLHWITIVSAVIVSIFIASFTQGAGLLLMIVPLIKYFTNEVAVTTKRVIIKYGWLGNNTLELNFSKVESVSVNQGIIGKILGYGTIIVGGTGGTRQPFTTIADPNGFRKALMHEQDKSITQ